MPTTWVIVRLTLYTYIYIYECTCVCLRVCWHIVIGVPDWTKLGWPGQACAGAGLGLFPCLFVCQVSVNFSYSARYPSPALQTTERASGPAVAARFHYYNVLASEWQLYLGNTMATILSGMHWSGAGQTLHRVAKSRVAQSRAELSWAGSECQSAGTWPLPRRHWLLHMTSLAIETWLAIWLVSRLAALSLFACLPAWLPRPILHGLYVVSCASTCVCVCQCVWLKL